MAIVDELITIFSFKRGKGSEKEFKEFNNAISSIRKKALLAGAALSGFGIAAGKIVQGVDQQAKFARAVGISFENLRKFQFAAKKAGASTGEFNAFLGNLAKTIVSLDPGGFNRTMGRLGIAARDAAGNIRPLNEVILDISKELSKKGSIRRLQFAGQFGAGVNIANFLGQSPEKIARDLQEAVKIGFVIPERLAGQFAEFFDDSLLKLRSTIEGFTDVLIASMLPAITDIVDSLEDWILKNKELLATDIGSFLKGAGEGFAFFGKGIKLVLDGITALVKPLSSANSELSSAEVFGFAAAAAIGTLAIATAAATVEWIALGAAITAILSVIPKLKTISDISGGFISKSKGLSFVRDFLGKISNPFDFIGATGQLAGAVAGGGLSAIAPGGTTNNARSSTTLNNTFNINGAQSPSETAKAVKEELELATALQSSSPGFNRPQVA